MRTVLVDQSKTILVSVVIKDNEEILQTTLVGVPDDGVDADQMLIRERGRQG